MYEPLHKLKFSFAAPYYDQIRIGVKWMAKERGAKKFCIIYQDDEFGLEVLRGSEDGLKDISQVFAEKTTFKRGATDFSAQVAKMKGSGCDTVVLGTIIRETIGTIGTARKMGWNPQFIGSSAAYTDLIHKLGGKAMDGLYAMHQVARALSGRSLEERARLGGAPTRPSSRRIRACSPPTATSALDLFYQTAQEGRAEPDHRQLRQGLRDHQLPARHVRQPGDKFTPDQPPGQPAVARRPDPERQVGGHHRLPDELSFPGWDKGRFGAPFYG